jgi:hydroxymethylbilane synthase
VRAGELDAVVLARAGLQRLGRADEATEVLDPLTMLPAPRRAPWRSSAARTTPS